MSGKPMKKCRKALSARAQLCRAGVHIPASAFTSPPRTNKNAGNAENVRKTNEKMQKSLINKSPTMQSWSPHNSFSIHLTSQDTNKMQKMQEMSGKPTQKCGKTLWIRARLCRPEVHLPASHAWLGLADKAFLHFFVGFPDISCIFCIFAGPGR